MSRSLPASKVARRVGAAAVLAIAAASLSACGDSSGAATSEVKPDNATATVHGIHVANIQLVLDKDVPGQAAVTGTIVSDSKRADALTGIHISGGGDAQLAPAGGKPSAAGLPVKFDEPVKLGGKNAASAIAKTTGVAEGSFRKVTFTFRNAGSVAVNTTVRWAQGALAGYGPTAAPTSAAPPKPGGKAGKPSSSPSTNATGNPSATPNASTSPSTGASAGSSASATR